MTDRYAIHITPGHGIALQVECVDCHHILLSVSAGTIDLHEITAAADAHDRHRHLIDDVNRQLAGARAAINAAERHLT